VHQHGFAGVERYQQVLAAAIDRSDPAALESRGKSPWKRPPQVLASQQDVLGAGPAASHHSFAAMGPEPLAASFGAPALARALRGKRIALKGALLDQRVVAGLGNIYASEALHRAGLSPLRRSSTLATATGRPTPRVVRLAAAVKSVLREAIARNERPYRAGRFRVYDREGEPCPTPGCRGTIRRISQAGRSTFYCPACQR